MTMRITLLVSAVAALVAGAAASAGAQAAVAKVPASAARAASAANVTPPAPDVAPPPADYVIGLDDVLSVVFWRDKDMSADVAVRPDGQISLPLLNDVRAAGLTPAQLRDRLTEEAKRFVNEPNVSVVVRQINSRRVFITGQVGKPGPYQLTGPITVLQLIATAGGLLEYAHGKEIIVVRTENARQVSYRFNYNDVIARRNLRQNIALKPGDTVIVP
jgi:polysaccharide export outer membrane protein